ncbi:hypothetical protein F443_00150 [Phytophthora nicotianae P1569]|uniref:Uncharacterized protein n=1 Tax=Phytophthora nicotianae P1569 TaxID=1317065 RepID=V9G335_PHYNI|nr:hypothetical protein F443_00150 [Phytophthora nicotianae P1569]
MASRCSGLPPSASEIGINKLAFNNNFNSNCQSDRKPRKATETCCSLSVLPDQAEVPSNDSLYPARTPCLRNLSFSSPRTSLKTPALHWRHQLMPRYVTTLSPKGFVYELSRPQKTKT